IFFSRIPRRAAVAATVEAIKELELSRASGFCNAILRKLATEETPLPPELERRSVLERLALEQSHPSWLVERWLHRYGEVATRAILEADNAAPSLVIRANQR